MKALRTIAITVIIIGAIGISMNILFGYNTVTYLYRYRVETTNVWLWRFDIFPYIKNIEMSISDTSKLQLELPTRQWITNVDLTNWPIVFVLNLGLMVDYIIMIINILLYPLKVGAYVLRQVLAVIGINVLENTNNGIQWLIDLINNIIGANIPYI